MKNPNTDHPREGGDPALARSWVPAFAGTIGVVVIAISMFATSPGAAAKEPSFSQTEETAHDEPHPFDETRNATADVDAALAAAKQRGTRVLLVLGGNWCHDSRGLAKKFKDPDLAVLLAEHYELVWIDVGHRDRNMDIPERFGVHGLIGTPSILILSASGELLNAESVHDWRNAASETLAETYDYFAKWAGDE